MRATGPGWFLHLFRLLAGTLVQWHCAGDHRIAFGNPFLQAPIKRKKGLQLALEPLNGQGIAGYVPEPELWTRPR